MGEEVVSRDVSGVPVEVVAVEGDVVVGDLEGSVSSHSEADEVLVKSGAGSEEEAQIAEAKGNPSLLAFVVAGDVEVIEGEASADVVSLEHVKASVSEVSEEASELEAVEGVKGVVHSG